MPPEKNQTHGQRKTSKMKMMILASVLAAGLFGAGCAHCKDGSCAKPAAMKCDGSCCSDHATCAKCCTDAAGCAKCCHKS
jgi:hypothetical protein